MALTRECNSIVRELVAFSKELLGDAFDSVTLFGSYARGDYDSQSDVDLMVRVRCTSAQLAQYQKSFILLSSRLSLKYGIEVSITLIDLQTYEQYKSYLPFFENIEKEGVKIA